ncbi:MULTISPECIES: type I-C CRISPR-associated protein Cas8c/Csd1 [unclassified Methanoregula]|uniref:type I-C CRISPR-associated protein Cas8c/Csd1 n=1 Tax=unclassified Methanoregula TaxID=2649730 RepID=UPI0009C628CC|nr:MULTISPECIES: type I-C CRISPR-associated protein Cas8c/Csd1 [unclassified Methanoregula]OPX62899.1 MAG: CRISPR-associated protein (Cas_Csd1) [Methanoregula sp. PtaB.Bin085]OPY35336.1 MAG: CRISPR-associated protein (Cas_Csd1) [Methanoregula sp. PtaU1.Bin006]
MIVQSLVRYYDILAGDKSVRIAKSGYSPAKVSFALVLSTDGELTNIVDLRSDDRKKTPATMDVPYQKSRAVAVTPYFVCDNAKYFFGIEKLSTDPKKKTAADIIHILSEDGKEKIVVSKRSRECFDQCRILHHSLMDAVTDPVVKTFLKFLDTWIPEHSLQHPKVAEYKDRILDGGLFVFQVADGQYIHQNSVVRKCWESGYSTTSEASDTEYSQCLVTGKKEPIARIHQKIKGVFGAQSAGATLIGCNDPAFWSYNKEQSYNSPISESAMFKYTTVLNHLLEHGSRNRIQIGDTTTVFWAETEKKTCENLALFFIDPIEEEDPPDAGSREPARTQDRATRQLVGDILAKVRIGGHLEEKDLGVDPETTNFYVLGLSPNNARLAVRFWYQDNFGNFITRVARHHLDMEIERDSRGPQYISVYRLLRETVPQNSSDKAASPLLGGLLMRSILDNTPYPVPMYNAILNRVKTERSIHYTRAGFIKACLIRMARTRGKHEEDLITVSLNEESTNVPYRLGRLFAVLEKAQSDSNKDLKSTINSKYFSSASTTPAVVFPVLLKLAQHHIAKSDWGFKSNQWIEEVISGINEFPAYMNLEDQGMFMIGYYHQRKAFFKKKEESDDE